MLRQTGIIISPIMELLLPLGHALLERPPMRDRRVAIITMGGSWGVALSDALVLHGMGRPGMLGEDAPERLRLFLDINKEVIRGFNSMENETGLPVLIGSIYTPWESQMVYDLNEEGIRIYNRLDEIAQILNSMHKYWERRRG